MAREQQTDVATDAPELDLGTVPAVEPTPVVVEDHGVEAEPETVSSEDEQVAVPDRSLPDGAVLR